MGRSGSARASSGLRAMPPASFGTRPISTAHVRVFGSGTRGFAGIVSFHEASTTEPVEPSSRVQLEVGRPAGATTSADRGQGGASGRPISGRSVFCLRRFRCWRWRMRERCSTTNRCVSGLRNRWHRATAGASIGCAACRGGGGWVGRAPTRGGPRRNTAGAGPAECGRPEEDRPVRPRPLPRHRLRRPGGGLRRY